MPPLLAPVLPETPAKIPSLLKLNTGCRSLRREAGRIVVSKLSSTSGSALGEA